MSQQGLRQASVRLVSGTQLNYEGDWHAMWDLQGIPAGPFNGRMLAYINEYLSAAYTEINGAMYAFAASFGASTFQSLGTFDAGLGPSGDGLLLEDVTGFLLLESGDFLLLE